MIGILWLVLSAAARASEKSWFAPASLLALIMTASYLGTALFAPEYYLSDEANMLLQLYVAVFLLGSLAGIYLSRFSQPTTNISQYVVKSRRLFWFGMFTSLVGFVSTLQVLGVGLGDIANPLSLMRVAQAATRQRYEQGLSFPAYYNLANALTLVYCMMLSLSWAFYGRPNWRMFLPLLLFVASYILITTRAPVLFAALIMCFSFIYGATAGKREGRPPHIFKPKSLLLITIGFAAVAGLFFYVQTLRFGENSQRSAGEVWEHLRRWPWGSIPGFSVWYDGGAIVQESIFGYLTFSGILDNLGIADRTMGAYSEYIRLTADEPGNIFMVFRGLIADFGFVGAAVFLLLLGSLGGFAYNAMRSQRMAWCSLYVAVMCFVGWSFVFSFYAYTSHLVCFAIAPFAMRFFFQKPAESVPGNLAVQK